jgi:gamma-glutamyltranspeptidase/glutathione hydrolase
MDPYEASLAPRFWPLRDNFVLEVESRLPTSVTQGLAKMGVTVQPMSPYEWHTGSFQICWRDASTGRVNASTDPRRAGWADGL